MNDQPGAVYEAQPFETSELDYRAMPGQTDLFLDFLYKPETVRKFFPNQHADLIEFADKVLASYKVDRSSLCEVLEEQNRAYGAGAETFSNISLLREEGTVAVVTGQQAGLFTGPAYTIYKAVSAVQLAKQLSAKGKKAVPVFWIASEDHDLEEIRKTFVPSTAEGLTEVACTAGPDSGSKPVDSIALGDSVIEALATLGSALGETSQKNGLLDLVASCYRPESTYSMAFGRLLASLMGEHGLVLMSPMDPGIRKLVSPAVTEILSHAGEIRSALIGRDQELKEAGYHSQVRVGEDFFPFFLIDHEGNRVTLKSTDNETVVLPDSGSTFGKDELLERFQEDPSMLSPSALIRPVIQDHLLPTVCYVGGAAEISYFAQNSAVYEVLGKHVTPARHRAAFTVIEPRNRRTMDAYALRFEDLLEGQDPVETRVAEEYLNPEVADSLENAVNQIETILDGIEPGLRKSDPSLGESLLKRKKKMLWHMEALHKKFVRAEGLKDEVVARRLGYLFESILPGGGPQERAINVLYFINELGDSFLDWLFAAEPESESHKVLRF